VRAIAGGNVTDAFQKRSHFRHLRFEPLESRRVLSITVDTLVDENNGVGLGAGTSLREAIGAAAAGDTINFSVTGTISLSVGASNTAKQLTVSKNLTISGPGASLLTIKAFDPTPATKNGDGSRVFTIDNNNAATLLDVAISGLTVTGGDTATAGGAISTAENLLVTDCVISGSTTTLSSFFDGGGGIFSSTGNTLANSLTVRGSTFSGNTASGSEGGAIRKRSGSLTVEDCTFTSNSALHAGGGISSSDNGVASRISGSTFTGNQTSYIQFGGGAIFGVLANFTVENCTISGNIGRNGGAINTRASSMLLTGSVISGNSGAGVGGGVYTRVGSLSISKCTIAANTGAGVYAIGSALTVSDSTINANPYPVGAGVFLSEFQGTAATGQITNSTISGNTATTAGGAVYNKNASMTIRSSTITSNTSPPGSSGAVVSFGAAPTSTSVLSTIIAGNINGDVVFAGALNTFASSGFNIVGTGNAAANFNQAGDQTGVLDPMLGSLANNGGLTKTHSPLAGSPAIDAGDPAAVAGMGGVPLYDQRGTPYARVYDGDAVVGGRIDIGAVEVQTLPLSAAVYGDYDGSHVVDGSDYVLWRKTAGFSVTAYNGADGSGNGTVGLEDYDVWRAHYGEAYAAGSGAGSEERNASAETLAIDRAFGGESASQPAPLLGVAQPLTFATVPIAVWRLVEVAIRPRIQPPAEPGAVGRLCDDALLAWVESAHCVRALGASEFEPIGGDSAENAHSDTYGPLDIAVGELISGAL
jgi:predicted outer membrane repeat protein